MGRETFDDLLRALQWSLAAAREGLKKRWDERDVRADSLLSFGIPKPGAGCDEYEILTLSPASFRDKNRPRISTLSLEFECELKEKRISWFSRERRMVMQIGKRSGPRKMRIVFRGPEQGFGEVLLDGELLMVIPPIPGAAGCRISVAPEKGLFRKLPDLWAALWRPREFLLAEQQAIRIREMWAKRGCEA